MDDRLLQRLFRSTRHQPTKVEGRLCAIDDSGHFKVARDDGSLVHGILSENVSAGYLARFLGQPVAVFGWGLILPGGDLLFVFAEGVLPQLQSAVTGGLPGQSDQAKAEMAERLRKAIGTWPGNETDEQIEQAMRT